MVNYRAARIAQRRAIAYENEGRTFLYLARHGQIARVGTCTANGLRSLESQGWSVEQYMYWQDDRPSALAAERAILKQVREWGYGPALASGSAGWTKSFDAAVTPWVRVLLSAYIEEQPAVTDTRTPTTIDDRVAFGLIAAVVVGVMLTILLANSPWVS